jgi:hypothetical protein
MNLRMIGFFTPTTNLSGNVRKFTMEENTQIAPIITASASRARKVGSNMFVTTSPGK